MRLVQTLLGKRRQLGSKPVSLAHSAPRVTLGIAGFARAGRARTSSVMLAIVLCCLASVLLAGTAQAAPPNAQQRAFARELYTNGQQLFRQGDFAGAQRSFEEAYRVVPNPVVLLSVAECQTRTEQYAAAIESLKLYLAERANAPDKAQVEAQIQALSAKPATLTVESSVSGAAIAVDNADTGRITPANLELAAGDHTVAVTLDGYVRAEQAVSLAPGGKESIQLQMMPAAPAEVATPAAEPAPVEPERTGRHAGKAVWIATGIAGGGLLTGTILGIVALKKKNDFDDKPSESLADSGEKVALFADVGFGIAAAAGITAVVLYLTSDTKKPEDQQQAWSVQPALSSGRAGVVGRLRF